MWWLTLLVANSTSPRTTPYSLQTFVLFPHFIIIAPLLTIYTYMYMKYTHTHTRVVMNCPLTILLPVLSSHIFNFTRLISYHTRFPIEMVAFQARTSVIVTVIWGLWQKWGSVGVLVGPCPVEISFRILLSYLHLFYTFFFVLSKIILIFT